MLDHNDLQQIKNIVEEVVGYMTQPSTNKLMDAILQAETRQDFMETRLESKFDALNRKLDRRCDEILAALNEYATVADRRVARLEAFHA